MRQNVTIPKQGQQSIFTHHVQEIATLAEQASTDDWNQLMGDLTKQYGAGLERLDSYSKQVMRASLSLYLCWLHKLTKQRLPVPETLIDEAIDRADPDCWGDDREVDQHICAIATLHPQYIEGFLDMLTNQLSLAEG